MAWILPTAGHNNPPPMSLLRSCLAAACAVAGLSTFAWTTPVFTSPADGAVVSTAVALDWYVVSNSLAYQCQLDTSAGFGSPLFRSVTNAYINSQDGNPDTRSAQTGLRYGTRYFWRIRAYVAGDTSAWSTLRQFTTADQVAITGPDDGITTNVALRLDWYPQGGTAFYDAELDTSLQFNSPLLRVVADAYINGQDGNPDTQWDLTTLRFGTLYHWRLRARNGADTSAWVMRSFTTGDLLDLTAPADLAVNVAVTGVALDWAPFRGVAYYQVQLDTTPLFSSPLLAEQVTAFATVFDGQADTRYSTGALRTDQLYFWRARAYHATDTSAWAHRIFTTGSSILMPAVPQLVAPADLTTVPLAQPTLVWGAATNATQYEYQYATSADLSNASVHSTTATQAATAPLALGDHVHWRVRSVNGNLVSAWSDTWQFIYELGTGMEEATAVDVMVCPNPTTGLVMVRVPQGCGLVNVMAMNGAVVHQERVTAATAAMDLSALPAGVYFVQCTGTERSVTLRLLRQ